MCIGIGASENVINPDSYFSDRRRNRSSQQCGACFLHKKWTDFEERPMDKGKSIR